MSTRGRAIARDNDTLEKPLREPGRSAPQAGDILAAERRARADVYTVSIVAADSTVTLRRYSAVIELVKTLARARRVNGWFTSDQTHYARVASHRSGTTGRDRTA
jgi:hypothetical protein